MIKARSWIHRPLCAASGFDIYEAENLVAAITRENITDDKKTIRHGHIQWSKGLPRFGSAPYAGGTTPSTIILSVQWVHDYNYSLGIERDRKSSGFKHFILHPESDPTNHMTFYESLYGKIESSWEKKNDTTFYHFVVPLNTIATLYLNAIFLNAVTENGKPLKSSKGIRYIG